MNMNFVLLLISLIIQPLLYSQQDDSSIYYHEFAIIIPTYNAIEWYKKCLDSILMQDYPEDKVQVFVIDDCSTDGQAEAIEQYIEQFDTKGWITLIKNEQKWWAAGNRWKAAHWCKPETIIVDVDGDDWLANPHVLTRVNEEYNKGDVLVTWGQWQSYPKAKLGTCRAIPEHILQEKKLRSFHATDLHDYEFATGHLRTYKAWIFQQIKLKDFLFEGQFYRASCDVQIMLSVLEVAQERSSFISDILYIYNCINPISDWRTKLAAQRDINNHIRSQKPYPRIEQQPMPLSFEVDMILLVENPLKMESYLKSVAQYVKDVHKGYILISSDYRDHGVYKRLKEDFPKYSYIEYEKETFKDSFLQTLEQCNDFIFLSIPKASLVKAVDLVQAAQVLHKVHAHAFYAPTKLLRRFFSYTKCLVPVDEGDIAAWQYCYAKESKSNRLALAGTLYKKSVPINCINNTIKTIKDFEFALTNGTESDDLGLVYQAFVKGLMPEPQPLASSYITLNWFCILLLMLFCVGIGIFIVRPNMIRLP